MLFFHKAKSKRARQALDTIRVQKIVKKTTRHPIFSFCLLLGCLAISLALSFWGTVSALELKEKANILQLFKSGRYLIIFQNNAELRPSGGFIGSFATVAFRDYKVEQLDFNTNIYKLDNAFVQTNQILPPKPLAQISHNRWSLHDANFAPDFTEAAQDIQWFYREESGDQVDGVIAINASFVQEILAFTGPIYLKDYDSTISADNFYRELAQKIEKEYFYNSGNLIENEPKTILKDLMPVLFEKILTLKKMDLLNLTLSALNKKQILLQSNNQEIEGAILASNWGGKIKTTPSDYLAINNANITDTSVNKNWGAKTSLSIEEKIHYTVNGSSSLTGNLTLTRSHNGTYNWPDGVNINWTRVLVPLGSELKTAELNGRNILTEIEISETAGKTCFGLWINTAPQTSNILNLSYKLPISAANYSLLTQIQPGAPVGELTAILNNKLLYNDVLEKDLLIK